jgi:hypothetical protein
MLKMTSIWAASSIRTAEAFRDGQVRTLNNKPSATAIKATFGSVIVVPPMV